MNKKSWFRLLSARSFVWFAMMGGYALLSIAFGGCCLFFFRFSAHDFIVYAVMLAVFAIVWIVMTVSYYHLVYVPFKTTSKLMRAFNIGHGVEPLSHIKTHLSAEMTDMIDRIYSLTEMQYKIKESKRQAEYLALQSQINPHFLYNTLEAIRGDALSAGVHSIAEITEALATFFRYTISTAETLVTLEDELNNAENYFIIQRYRFGDRLELSVECDSGVLEYKLPKMTLQPMIENAIYHGIERKCGPGRIKIAIETTKTRLLINVIDDGVGIEENKLNQLNEKLTAPPQNNPVTTREKGGIALMNVNDRIKLLFGELYGIRITSTVDIGTDIEIILPLKN